VNKPRYKVEFERGWYVRITDSTHGIIAQWHVESNTSGTWEVNQAEMIAHRLNESEATAERLREMKEAFKSFYNAVQAGAMFGEWDTINDATQKAEDYWRAYCDSLPKPPEQEPTP
jgi:hypothetical protein